VQQDDRRTAASSLVPNLQSAMLMNLHARSFRLQ
jgi:hypothetical protein